MSGADLDPVLLVFLYGLITALATGLGALPFAFLKEISPRVIAYSNAIASGLMLGACFGLMAQGTRYGSTQTVAGGVVGVLFILLAQRWLGDHDLEFGQVRGAGASRMILMVIVMTVHSFSEGVAIGSSFAGGLTFASLITVAIAVHNIPEGLAISAVMRPRGSSVAACAGWSVFSSLPQPLMAVPAFLFVDAFAPALPYGIGFAAGAMFYMVFVELLPEAYEQAPRPLVSLVTSVALVAMLLFQRFI
ncbi:MAG: ZIP family metal transporter [bacterium]|nr:ZIP family metal transporter [bacterium]